MCVCVCVCSLSYVLAVGSSVAFQPHTINMSLWRGRGAPGMLTCGGAALTTIDKRVRWLLVIKIPGGESYIGGHLTSRLEAVVASFLSGSSLLLKRVICLLRTLTKQPITLLFTGWLISVRAKNALNHRLPASETNTEWNGRGQYFPDQVSFYECLSIFIHTAQKCSHSLHEAEGNSATANLALKAGFGQKMNK